METVNELTNCFICHSATKNVLSRRRGYAVALCKLFSLPNTPYEDQLCSQAIYCSPCLDKLQKVFNLFRKLDNIKDEILNFRVLIENELTNSCSSHTSQSLALESVGEGVQKNSQPEYTAAELRLKVVQKITFVTSVEDAGAGADENEHLQPTDDSKGNEDVGVDINCKSEISSTELFQIKTEIDEESDWESDQSDHNINDEYDDSDFSSSVKNVLPAATSVSLRVTRSQSVLKARKLEIKAEHDVSDDQEGTSEMAEDQFVLNNSFNEERRKRKIKERSTSASKRSRKIPDVNIIVRKKKSKKYKEKTTNRALRIPCTVDNCRFSFTEESYRDAHIKRYHEGVKKPHKCTQCNKTYKFRAELNLHRLTHSGERPFVCEQCGKSLTNRALLKLHIQNMHSTNFPLNCEHCHRGYHSMSRLKQHLLSHTKEYPYVCDCGRKFSSLNALQNHQGLHKEEYKCDVCEKYCGSKENLRLHKITHTKEYPFVCPICSHGSCRKQQFNNHMRKHEGVKLECDICHKMFSSEYTLVNHKKIHDGSKVKKCVCDICGKAFTDKYKLNRHIQYHTGNKPFQCQICSKNFYTKDYLCVHMGYHEKSGKDLRNQTRKRRVWQHSVESVASVHRVNPSEPSTVVLQNDRNVDLSCVSSGKK